jgi:hypothetical protein
LDIEKHNQKASTLKKENRIFFDKLKRIKPKNLDNQFHTLHDEVFEEIDCLACANCCKTTSPIFYNRDIERLAKHLRQKPGEFIDKYLRIDEDKDYVLRQAPCPFLGKRMEQILDLTYRNTLVCPAVLEITERLKKVI